MVVYRFNGEGRRHGKIGGNGPVSCALATGLSSQEAATSQADLRQIVDAIEFV
jgi:hypothetical protein